MESTNLKCPLCCEKTFDSRTDLVEHLMNLSDGIVCPICQSEYSSLDILIEHLKVENCSPITNTISVLNFNLNAENRNEGDLEENSMSQTEVITSDQNEQPKILTDFALREPIEDGGQSRMYVELLSKQLMKPCLQTQELKLVKDGDVSRYVILTDGESNVNVGNGGTIVTKQNNDGTISLTTIHDMKMETEPAPADNQELEESHDEIYSCNTCGVSFTSVLDHIQNYHNDQDVVLEEQGVENETIEYPPDPLELNSNDKQLRRMITESGDIVETPMFLKTASVELDEQEIDNSKGSVAKSGKPIPTRCFVMVDKFCDSVVKNIKEPDGKGEPYHKVVIKEMETENGAKMKVYNCMSCNMYVSTLDEFKLHPCKVLLKYPCSHPGCTIAYDNAKSLCAHMKIHKVKNTTEVVIPPSTFECEICSTVFPTNKSLKLHKRMHDPIKSRTLYPPEVKGEVNHDKFLCSTCNKLIPIDYRVIHQNSHKNADKFNCDICNKKFFSGEYLEMHMTVHANEKVSVIKHDKSLPYNCIYCDRRFARPHEKVKHERIHTGEKPHSCEICGKSFRVSYCLTLHMRTHTGARPYACPHCGKRFKAHSVYNHHLLTHSEVRAYKCPYCPKAFKTSVQLAGHKNSHTKPFSCQHCNRPFASLYAVRVHTETHSRQNNLKFSCGACGASYARAFALKDHIKQVHNRDAGKADGLTIVKEDDWTVQQNSDADVEEVQGKGLQNDMSDQLSIMNTNISNELVVP